MSFLLHDPVLRALDDNGAIMPGAYFIFYETGTTTIAEVYADSALTTPLGQVSGELIANAAGRWPAIYGDSAIVYRRQLYGADDVLVDGGDVDPVHPHVDFPPGSGALFFGTAVERDAAYPPALWQWCDGSNGTPDMRGALPIGANGSTYVADGTAYGSAPGNVTSSSNGAHTHTGATGSTAADLAAHTHLIAAATGGSSSDTTVTNSTVVDADTPFGGDSQYRLRQRSSAAAVGLTSSTGAGGGHTHTVSSDGAHTHTTAIPLPPCKAWWFLMRLP